MQNQSYSFEGRLPQNDLFLFLASLIKNSFAITKIPIANQAAELNYISTSHYRKKINGIVNSNRHEQPIVIYI